MAHSKTHMAMWNVTSLPHLWHHCWNAQPTTSLCSLLLFGLHKCSTSINESQRMQFFLFIICTSMIGAISSDWLIQFLWNWSCWFQLITLFKQRNTHKTMLIKIHGYCNIENFVPLRIEDSLIISNNKSNYSSKTNYKINYFIIVRIMRIGMMTIDFTFEN